MRDFILRIWTGESHWAMENAAWFLTLFAGIWLIPILFFNKLSSYGKRFIVVGVIYLLSLYFRSNMMETRVYNELNVIVSILVICVFDNLSNKSKTVIRL
jgi:hypothetical protein